MKKLTKGVRSVKSREELTDILNRPDTTNRALVSDFDGTLFRGTTGHFLHGISISYLSLYLLPLMIKSPTQEMNFIKHNLDVLSLLRQGKQENNPEQRTQLEKKVVTNYCNSVLQGVSYDKIVSASRVLQYHIYHQSLDLFATLADKSTTSAIITKTIKPIVEHVEKKLRRSYDLYPTIIANDLATNDGKVTGLDMEQPVFTKYDKAEYAYTFLSSHPDITHAIILGDTSEDVGMFEAARDLYGYKNVLAIALHPKDKQIRERADCIVTNIPSFNRYITAGAKRFETMSVSEEEPYFGRISRCLKYPF